MMLLFESRSTVKFNLLPPETDLKILEVSFFVLKC